MTSPEARKAYLARRHERLVGEVREQRLPELLETHGERTVAIVRAYAAEHGKGPTWGYVRDQLSLSRPEIDVLMRELARQGRVTYTSKKHSLRAA